MTNDVRNALRAALLQAPVLKREAVKLNGVEFELLQPVIEEVMTMWADPSDNRRFVKTLIALAVVPGTEIRVFEDTDEEVLANTPFSAEVTTLQEAVTRLMVGISVEQAEKN